MAIQRHLSTVVALLLAAGSATAQVRAGEWVSYRDAYRAMVLFEKYGKPKNLLQSHLQIMPREKGGTAEGLQLTLSGFSTQLNLPLDPLGRTVFPLLKTAYDENAALVLNRKVSQYAFRSRVSLLVRPDGVYEAPELRAACEQALNSERHLDASLRNKHCVGVRFVFAKKGVEPGVRLRNGGDQGSLPVLEGAAFGDDPEDGFKTVTYRFADGQDKGQVVTQNAPLAIAALFD